MEFFSYFLIRVDMLVSSWSINKVHVSVWSFCTRDGLFGGPSALPMSFHVPHCIFCTTQHHLKTCFIFQKFSKHFQHLGSDFNTLLLLLKYLKTKLRCHADVLLQHQHGEWCLMHIVEVQVHVRPCHNGISRVQTKNGFLGHTQGFLIISCFIMHYPLWRMCSRQGKRKGSRGYLVYLFVNNKWFRTRVKKVAPFMATVLWKVSAAQLSDFTVSPLV